MALPPEKIQARAIKAGIRASKRSHQLLSKRELLKLKIQILPNALRWAFLISGVLMIIGAIAGWPFSQDSQQTQMGIGGGSFVVFAFFGVRHTLGHILEVFSSDGGGSLLEAIFEAIGSAVDF